jgi:RimJ/RimL family protein N-acetyltransferase
VNRVRLRQATVADAGLLERWQQPAYIGEFNRFGIPPRPLRDEIREHGLVGSDRGALIVELVADSTPIGTVSWHPELYGPNAESVAWNIGINLIPEGRGRGYGGEAQRLLADWLFASTAANRVEAMTDVENVAEQRALEKAGFRREGILYGSQFRGGAWRDLVVYSLLRAQAGSPPTIASG